MKKLILLIGMIGICSPAFAQNYHLYSPAADSLARTTEYRYANQPCVNPLTGGYTPTCTYSPDINPPITRSEYPGALDPVRNLPEWVYNP